MNFIGGISLVILGVLIVIGYEKMKRNHKTGGFSFKIQTAGIAFVLLGLYIIATELTKII